jgi:uncharacterized membrane protein YdjX (TVP38/TMEM64 family)
MNCASNGYERLPVIKKMPNFTVMPDPTKPSKRPLRLPLLLGVPAAIGAAILYAAWSADPDIDYWLELIHKIQALLAKHPLLLILALATLPGIGVPLTPVLLLFGIVMGSRFGMPTTCFIGMLTMAGCTTWTYLLAAGPLRGFLTKYILKQWQLPELSDQSALRLGLIIRITPGLPYALQNIALGVMGMRLKPYLMVSLPIQSLYTVALIITGGALFEGQTGIALFGVLLFIIIILVARMLRNRSKQSPTHVR